MIRKNNLYRRLLIYLLPIGLLLFLVFSRLYKVPLQWFEMVTTGVIYSVQEGTHSVTTGIGNTFSHYFFLVGLHDENALLKKEVDKLHGEVHRLQEEESRAQRLRKVLQFKQAAPWNLIAAEVIGRGADAWSNTLMINKGIQEGVRVGQGVITPRGVVGKVVKTFSHHAQVLLMTDAKSAIAAIVQRTREEGIVHGLGNGGAQMKYLPPVAKVAEGDVLITSGMEGSFTKGLRMGRIKKIQVLDDDFFLKVTVTPEISFSKLEEVLVVTLQETTLTPASFPPTTPPEALTASTTPLFPPQPADVTKPVKKGRRRPQSPSNAQELNPLPSAPNAEGLNPTPPTPSAQESSPTPPTPSAQETQPPQGPFPAQGPIQ